MTERAVKHVRKFLGQRLRALRKQRALSQERLGEEAEKIFALVSGRRRPEDIRKAYNVLRAMFGRAS